jgi:dinuclear metal center YbgI/SA1388 family protein
MIIQDIIKELEIWAPPALQESYDNSGLLVGDKSSSLSGCLVTLDVTESVIDEAIGLGFNLIIAHHPLIFSGLKKLTGSNYIQRAVIKAIKNDIAIYALHTNLDHVRWGVNRRIGQLLGLDNLKVLAPKPNQLLQLTVFAPQTISAVIRQAMCDAGAGHIGEYKDCSFTSTGVGRFTPTGEAQPAIGRLQIAEDVIEDKIEVILPRWKRTEVLEAAKKHHIYEELAYYEVELLNTSGDFGSGMFGEWPEPKSLEKSLELIKKTFGGVIRFTKDNGMQVKRVAFCGGSGSFLLPQAVASKADLFITSDFKYHQFFDADRQIVVADVGHFEIEQFTSQLIVDHLSQKFTTFAPQISAVNTNPVGYY